MKKWLINRRVIIDFDDETIELFKVFWNLETSEQTPSDRIVKGFSTQAIKEWLRAEIEKRKQTKERMRIKDDPCMDIYERSRW